MKTKKQLDWVWNSKRQSSSRRKTAWKLPAVYGGSSLWKGLF